MVPEENVHVIDLLPAFVVCALTEEETYQVASHLEVCPTCRAELKSLQQVADDLPLALAQTEPPARLKANLMESVHKRQAQATVSEPPVKSRKLEFKLQRLLPVFGIAVFIVLAVVNVVLWRQLYNGSLQAGSNFQSVALANTENSPGAMGELVLDPNGQYGTLVVDNLAKLDSTKQYQVWLVKNGERTSGGVFSVNPDGYAALELYAPMPLRLYDSIGISVEPFGGSPAPTGDKVLGGNIPR